MLCILNAPYDHCICTSARIILVKLLGNRRVLWGLLVDKHSSATRAVLFAVLFGVFVCSKGFLLGVCEMDEALCINHRFRIVIASVTLGARLCACQVMADMSAAAEQL